MMLIAGMVLLAVMTGIVGAFLMAQVPLLFCRAGFHKWETPPFSASFAAFPQFKPYEQCVRVGCWKTRGIEEPVL